MSYRKDILFTLGMYEEGRTCAEICTFLKTLGNSYEGNLKYLNASVSSILRKLRTEGLVEVIPLEFGPRGGMKYKITEKGKNW